MWLENCQRSNLDPGSTFGHLKYGETNEDGGLGQARELGGEELKEVQ